MLAKKRVEVLRNYKQKNGHRSSSYIFFFHLKLQCEGYDSNRAKIPPP